MFYHRNITAVLSENFAQSKLNQSRSVTYSV